MSAPPAWDTVRARVTGPVLGTFATNSPTHRFTKLASLDCLQVAHLQPSVPGALRALREYLLTLLNCLL